MQMYFSRSTEDNIGEQTYKKPSAERSTSSQVYMFTVWKKGTASIKTHALKPLLPLGIRNNIRVWLLHVNTTHRSPWRYFFILYFGKFVEFCPAALERLVVSSDFYLSNFLSNPSAQEEYLFSREMARVCWVTRWHSVYPISFWYAGMEDVHTQGCTGCSRVTRHLFYK